MITQEEWTRIFGEAIAGERRGEEASSGSHDNVHWIRTARGDHADIWEMNAPRRAPSAKRVTSGHGKQ